MVRIVRQNMKKTFLTFTKLTNNKGAAKDLQANLKAVDIFLIFISTHKRTTHKKRSKVKFSLLFPTKKAKHRGTSFTRKKM